MALLVVTGYGAPVVASTTSVLAQASAKPSPGQPGRHKHQNKDKKNHKRDSKESSSQRDSSTGTDSNTSSEERKAQTDANNRWTPDGPNRSVNTRVSSDLTRSQAPPPDRTPTESSVSESTEQPSSESLVTDTSARTPLQQESLTYFRGRPPTRRIPSTTTSDKLKADVRQFEDPEQEGGKYFNRDPFNEGTPFEGEPDTDHLIPVEQAVRLNHFPELSWEDQEKILDADVNIVPATPSENRSRQNKLFTDYSIRSRDGRPLDEAYRQMRIEQTRVAFDELQRQVDERYAAGSRRPGLPDASSGPVELPATQAPLEVPLNQQPPELPATLGPPELTPVQAPEVPLTPPTAEIPANPVPPISNYPLPPVRPAQPPVITAPTPPGIGAPTTPIIGTAIPPVPAAAPPPSIGVPVTVVPTFSTPPVGPVTIPGTSDPLATLRGESNALEIELNTISDRLFALQNTPGFDTRTADIAESQALRGLSALVTNRHTEIGYVLANPPEQLRPPPSTWSKALHTIGTGLSAVGTAAIGALNFVRRPFALLGG